MGLHHPRHRAIVLCRVVLNFFSQLVLLQARGQAVFERTYHYAVIHDALKKAEQLVLVAADFPHIHPAQQQKFRCIRYAIGFGRFQRVRRGSPAGSHRLAESDQGNCHRWGTPPVPESAQWRSRYVPFSAKLSELCPLCRNCPGPSGLKLSGSHSCMYWYKFICLACAISRSVTPGIVSTPIQFSNKYFYFQYR